MNAALALVPTREPSASRDTWYRDIYRVAAAEIPPRVDGSHHVERARLRGQVMTDALATVMHADSAEAGRRAAIDYLTLRLRAAHAGEPR